MRKDLGIEFEGFTYADRTLNIEVAYDFRQHGYAERNYISDPDEWSNLFHWKGPPDRWRVHFPTEPDEDEEALQRPEALQAQLQAFLPNGRWIRYRGSNLYTVHQRVAKKFRVGRAILAGDSAHVNQPDRRDGHEQRRARRVQSGRQADCDPARRGRRQTCSTATSASAATSRCSTPRPKPSATNGCWPSRTRRCAEANHDQLRRTAEDPKLARAFLLRTSLIESLREAEQIA